MNTTPSFFALLVGIDKYDPRSRVPHLRGCTTDADQMARLLRERYGLPPTNILLLQNEEATHQRIKEAFRAHLIENARRVAQQGGSSSKSPPAFLFQYSGHGSQAIDETGHEPDGLDETIVPYDSRTPGVFDIKDWELGALIEELNRYSDNVTVILDCCHSGSGTRAIQQVLTRRCAPDLRPQPIASQRPNTMATTRAVGAGNWEIGGRHVLLAGCRDKEESHEYAVVAAGRRYWQGAMSYFLQQALRQSSPTRTQTYRELFEQVRHAVNKTYANQMPQLEGDIDRELFGGLRPEREPFYTVIDRRDGLYWIDGGIAHGLTIGSELLVFPPETRTRGDADVPLATLRIVEDGAITSGCDVEEPSIAIPLHARCAIHRLNADMMQRTVQLRISDPTVLEAVRKRLGPSHSGPGLDVTPWLKIASPQDAADFYVVENQGALEIQDNGGKLLVAAFAITDLEGVANDLAHLARYTNALSLRNGALSELAGAMSIAIKQLDFDATTQAPIAVDFPRTVGDEPLIDSGDRVILEVTNHSDEDLYFALFDFSPDWSVNQLYPNVQGAHEALKAGSTFQLGLSNRRRAQLAATLPEGYLEATERFKVIATREDTNFELLQQGPLKSPFVTRAVTGAGVVTRGEGEPPSALDELLGRAVNGNQRAFGAPPATIADEWTTAELSVLVTAPAAAMTRSITPGARTVLPDHGVAIEAPAAFTGAVRILSEQQGSRAATRAAIATGRPLPSDAVQVPLPPGLAAYSDTFELLSLGNRRSALPMGNVLELDADDQARRTLSPSTPLQIHFDWQAGNAERVFALAYEDGIFYPVGHSAENGQSVAITWLPTAATNGDETSVAEEESDLVTRRSVGRVLKLYFYKLAGWQEASLGLHRVTYVEPSEVEWLTLEEGQYLREFEGGALLYSPIDASAILPRQRVAIAIHGFSADTKTIGRWLTTVYPKHFPAYDHVLAYDYESLATGIRENGRILANALRELELDLRPRVRVDLFAHSMGTLVARTLIELWGGDSFINRAFLVGPPNLGTRLADAKMVVPWVTSLAVNGLGGWTPAVVAEWALGKLSGDAIGLDDLRPASTLLADLNSSTKPVLVNYYVLAGNNSLLPQVDATLIQRLKHKIAKGFDVALDAIFSDQNDMVINVESMLGLRNGNYPSHLIQQQEVPCNHFSYFQDETAQTQLLSWLQ